MSGIILISDEELIHKIKMKDEVNKMDTRAVEKVRYDLDCRYDSRASFYGKAQVVEFEDGSSYLKSYSTLVACITKDGDFKCRGQYSQTTTRHIKEYARQCGNYGCDETDTIAKVLKLGDDTDFDWRDFELEQRW